jgi:hypothetical protein
MAGVGRRDTAQEARPGEAQSAVAQARRGQPQERWPTRHCRHCAGGHPGVCVISEYQCIHGWNGPHPRVFRWQLLVTRRWWHRVLWGGQR